MKKFILFLVIIGAGIFLSSFDKMKMVALPPVGDPLIKFEVYNHPSSLATASFVAYVDDEAVSGTILVQPGNSGAITIPAPEEEAGLSIIICGEGYLGNEVIEYDIAFKHYPDGIGTPPTILCSEENLVGAACPKTRLHECQFN